MYCRDCIVPFWLQQGLENPNIEDSKQADRQFDLDSASCDLKAGEEYPLDKRKQTVVYGQCMESKGWEARGQMEFYLPEKKK